MDNVECQLHNAIIVLLCFTRDHGAQLHHVDDELEAVAEDEDADDDDQDGPHHQVALLTLAQAAQPLRPGPGNM